MKFNYTIKQLNSGFDDNAVFLRNVYYKKAMLFDCGRLAGLDNSDLMDIAHVFVSHTHMDHFGGFDRFLRGCLNSGNTVRFYGPEGIIGNVEGKLRGYNWNLIRDYDFIIEAVELTPQGRLCKSFSAKEAFEGVEQPIEQHSPINLGSGFTLDYEFFDHGIVSIGYRVKEPLHIAIIKEKLDVLGLKAGAWLKELKSLLAAGKKSETILVQTLDGDKVISVEFLEQNIIEYHAPQDIVYITDIAPTAENSAKGVNFAKNADLLIIEAVFREEDKEHAELKKHLTITISKQIFIDSGANFVRFLHFASRYDKFRDDFYKELRFGVEGKIFSY